MSIASLLAFNLAILGALCVPGPALLSLLRQSLIRGRPAALATAAGLATAATLWSLAAIVGLSALFALVPWAYAAIKLAGAAYLGCIAVALWRGARDPLPAAVPSHGRSFRFGLLSNLSNPKAVFFIAAIFSTVFPVMPRGETAAFVLANHFALELAWYSAAALMLTTAPVSAAYLRAKAWIDRTSAVILGLIAVRTAT
ncbi:LysE family translocator [Acidimangrovimonas sediminis]|uniref:LysE family translocator n=1 Tax=Acidimangrovimonas sediminis TaxID=2056283 RepID=UPI000C80BF3B|nr:LysE family transporter [Acidimangrovimonas sediminis]